MARRTFNDLVIAASAKSGTGEVVVDRDYELKEPILFFDQPGFIIRGVGGYRPILHWLGTEGNMFDFANCRDTLIMNLMIHVHGKLDTGVHYWRKLKGRTTPTNNKHYSIAMVVQPGGYCTRFASHDYFTDKHMATGIDENNEFSLYDDCDVDGATDGIRFMGQQSHGHIVRRCRLNVKQTAITSSGWFCAKDVSGSGIGNAAFHITGVSSPIHIVRPNFEAVKRLLIAQGTMGTTGDSQPILIEGGSTRCDQLHADGAVIDLQTAGPLRVIAHQFGSGQQPVPHIRTWHPGVISIESCDVGSWDSYGKPFVRRYDTSEDTESFVLRTWLHRADGQPVRHPHWY